MSTAAMKALLYTGIGKLELCEQPLPRDEFLVRVLGSGVCGTDLKAYLKGHPMFTPPMVLGHEFYGRVERAPAGCGYSVGDPVVVAPYCECGVCGLCQRGVGQLCPDKCYGSGGAFVQFVGVPEADIPRRVFPIPREDDVYTLVEPLACVINGAAHLKLTPGSRVLIAGGGPMGALFSLLFSAARTDVTVMEPADSRRELIASWGIPVTVPDKADYGIYDNIVVAVNSPELTEQCVKGIADAGTVLVFSGLPGGTVLKLDAHSIHYREVTVTGSFGYAVSHFKEALERINENPELFAKAITHRLPLSEGEEAFRLLSLAEPLKLVLKPQEN